MGSGVSDRAAAAALRAVPAPPAWLRPVPRPYRFAPPRPGRPLIRRSPLLRRLHQRWDHRVTVVTAGAGFGKSSLLTQALDENALAPRGEDQWLGCGPADAEARSLAEGLAAVLEVELPQGDAGGADPAELATALASAVWARSPRRICLVLDDVHEIPEGSTAAELLAQLVDVLPTNGHLVLAGRHEPAVPLARLAAQGRVGRIGEHDLAFGDDELSAFAALRGVPLDRLRGLAGWPALAELQTLGEGDGITDFLDEEILSHLSPAERRAVATVAVIGGADEDLLARVLDEPVDLTSVLDRIPLVSCDEHGWHTIHALWSERLGDWLTGEQRAEAQLRAGRALLARDVHQAVILLAQAGADDELRDALLVACRARTLPVPAGGFSRLLHDLPPAVRDTAAGQLVAGIAAASTDLDRATAHLVDAARRFAADGDRSGVLTAIEHLALYAHWREDLGLLSELWELAEPVDDLPEGGVVRTVGNAVMADVVGDAKGVLAALDAGGDDTLAGYWSVPATWLRASALLALGFPTAAHRHVEVAVAEAGPSLQGVFSMLEVNSLVLSGRTDAARAAADRMIARLAQAGNAHTLALGHTVAAIQRAIEGRLDDAAHHLACAREHSGPDPHPLLTSHVVDTEAAIALAAGDEDRAAELLAGQVAERGIHDGREIYGNLRRLPALYVLVPATRAEFHATELGPCYRNALALAEALVASRASGDMAPAAALTPEHWAAATGFLTTGWRAELAAAAVAGGRLDADVVVKDLGPAARPALRRLADRPQAPRVLKGWARTLLDALPTVPAGPIEIGVLGPTALRSGGQPVEHPHWRRERVRALLLLLLAKGGGTREEIAGALWPDLDGDGALRNLRVTLSYLLTALEPQRGEGAPSCFVRADGSSLRLSGHEWLRVDAWEMERLLDEAAEAERLGEPSAALDLYRQASALYRGPYLADAGYEEWALPHRDRLTARFVAGAVRTGELALATGEGDEALQLAARAVEAEPWSEVAHRLAVAAHLARGDRAAARRAMDTCLRQLAELGVPPTEDTEILLHRLNA
jgi:LuxR family transcriptional regulator, maltose regulon positive regulatory protein